MLRSGHGGLVRPARMTSDLATSPFTQYAAAGVADPRLVDPHMEQVVDEARHEAREQGYAEGHSAGFEAGRREGLDLLAAQQQILLERDAVDRAARSERLTALVHACESAVAAALDYQAPAVEDLRDAITELAVEIADAVVGHHVEIGDCAAADAVSRALSMVPRHASVLIRLHPDDIAAVEAATSNLHDFESLRLVPDTSVNHGDAFAEATNLEVEASIAGAMERVRAVLNP